MRLFSLKWGRPIGILVLLFPALFCPAVSAEAAVSVEVSVQGVEGELLENVLSYLSVVKQKEHPDLTPALLKSLHRDAPEEIRRALQPFGYYGPGIQTDLMRVNGSWKAVYLVDAGQPVVIEAVDLVIRGEGSSDEQFRQLHEEIVSWKGEPLDHRRYEQGKRSLQTTAVRFGYLAAKMIVSRVEVDPDANTALIQLHFDTGPQYFFGDVQFTDDAFDHDFLSRFIPFRRGEPYHLSHIIEFQKALMDSDYFASVDIDPRTEEVRGLEVPVAVRLFPHKKHTYTLGAGYGTDTGVRGGLGWELRRVNRTGHRFSTDLRLSEIRSGITAEYTVPLEKVRTDSVVYTSGWVTEETDTSRSDKYFGGLRYSHIRYGLKEVLYVSFEQEAFDVGSQSGRSTLLIPGISWMLMRADNPVTTRRGGRFFLDFRGAHDALISDTSFLRLYVKAKYILGLSHIGRLIVRGEAGTSVVSRFSELPPSVRFFTGGDHSVRGYGYNALGPEDEGGDVIGGKHMFAGSVEYEHRIRGKWSAALFYDTGNAVDSFSAPLRSSTGFGLRWASPVGPLRIDIAFPFDEPDTSWRLHVTIGPDL